jgi:hypothetical protein
MQDILLGQSLLHDSRMGLMAKQTQRSMLIIFRYPVIPIDEIQDCWMFAIEPRKDFPEHGTQPESFELVIRLACTVEAWLQLLHHNCQLLDCLCPLVNDPEGPMFN